MERHYILNRYFTSLKVIDKVVTQYYVVLMSLYFYSNIL